MDKSSDRIDPGAISDTPYAVGNKKPPRHTRFKPGQSGNPSGRPKGRTNFDTTLLKEFYKPVSATINGKPIKVTNDKLFAASLVKDGITKGPQSKLQLANRVERAEAKLAAEAEAEARKKAKAPNGDIQKFEWTEAQQRLYEEVCLAAGVEAKV
jgi:Family of unknown function (DUF5681)